MPSPKDGAPGSLVAPLAPDEALNADVADPGQVESTKAAERESASGKYGSQEAKPYKKAQSSDEQTEKDAWIEIVLKDEDDQPVPGMRYRVILPDDCVAEGTLDGNGFTRLPGIKPGNCQVTFPDLDQEAWERA